MIKSIFGDACSPEFRVKKSFMTLVILRYSPYLLGATRLAITLQKLIERMLKSIGNFRQVVLVVLFHYFVLLLIEQV